MNALIGTHISKKIIPNEYICGTVSHLYEFPVQLLERHVHFVIKLTYICLFVIYALARRTDLRGNVECCSNAFCERSVSLFHVRQLRLRLIMSVPSQSKITNADIVFGVNKNVLRLQITMDD